MAIPAPYYSELDPRLKAVLDQITTKAVNGTVVPLFVDYKNQRVGIGNSVPAVPLHVSGETRIDNRLIFQAGYCLGMLSAQSLDVTSTLTTQLFGAIKSTIASLDVAQVFRVWMGDVTTEQPGRGIVVRTPDGTKSYRIAVDNAGAVTTTLI